MEYISCTINSHEEYIDLLNNLEKKTKHIEIVTPYSNGSEDDFISNIQEYIIEKRKVKSWWGTITYDKCSTLFRIKADKQIFNYLKKYSTFCIKKANRVELTDFGDKDIAFYDETEEPLFSTTTHEGYLNLREDLK